MVLVSFLSACYPSVKDIDANAPVAFANERYHVNARELTELDPVYLFIYANHLYEQGQKDESVFWFYVAQYRGKMVETMETQASCVDGKIFQKLSADAGSWVPGKIIVLGERGGKKQCVSRGHMYNTIHSGLGQSINYYAGSNVDNYIRQLDRVLAFEKKNRFDPFRALSAEELDNSKYPAAKKRAEGLAAYDAWLRTHKKEFEQKRAKAEEANKKVEELLKNFKLQQSH